MASGSSSALGFTPQAWRVAEAARRDKIGLQTVEAQAAPRDAVWKDRMVRQVSLMPTTFELSEPFLSSILPRLDVVELP